jgi:hypothetical protein
MAIKLREYQLLIEKRKWVNNSEHLPTHQIITAIANLPSDVFRNMLNLEEREKYYIKEFKILKEFEIED